MIYEHLTEFAGMTVRDWDETKKIENVETTIYRLSLSYEEGEKNRGWTDKFAEFLNDPASPGIQGLVIGDWGNIESGKTERNSVRVVEALVSANERLPKLRAIFFGDIISEESEISWILQTDLSPLFSAFPDLETLVIRGGDGLSLGTPRHDRLKTLIIQTGGLDGEVVRQLGQAQLPALEHLELWLGTSEYGATVELGDLEPILTGERFPKLNHLGLCNSEIVDQIAVAIVKPPVLEKISVLDLSMGTLSDDGASALLASPRLSKLEKLDLHHHYCTTAITTRLASLGPQVNVGDQMEADEFRGKPVRYVAVNE